MSHNHEGVKINQKCIMIEMDRMEETVGMVNLEKWEKTQAAC